MVSTIDLMEFVHALRQDFFERAAGLGWTEFTKDRGVSMRSFREVFLHLAYVEEQHLTEFCEGRATAWRPEVLRIPSDRYRTIGAVRRRLQEVVRQAAVRFPRWNTPEQLAQPVVWVAANRFPVRLSRDAALAQCVTEHLLHLGEVEAMLWQMDVEPPSTFWIARMVLHGTWPPPRSALVPAVRVRRPGRHPPSSSGRRPTKRSRRRDRPVRRPRDRRVVSRLSDRDRRGPADGTPRPRGRAPRADPPGARRESARIP